MYTYLQTGGANDMGIYAGVGTQGGKFSHLSSSELGLVLEVNV